MAARQPAAGEEVLPTPDYRALQSKARELDRLLVTKTLEAGILKEALEQQLDPAANARCLRTP